MGLPDDWHIIDAWLAGDCPPQREQAAPAKTWVRKCPEIQPRDSYILPASMDFWARFPKHPLPPRPTSPIAPHRLREAVRSCRTALSLSQKYRASEAIRSIEEGFQTPLLRHLPALNAMNSPSAAAHGDQFTDALATWVKQGYVAGPFHAPPTNDFRANTMLAIEQKGKVRIVMDLSQPDGESFNDAVDEDAIEKVHMSTARLFGHAVIDCGRGARMWKYDFTDAYKNIPAHPSDRRLQGFRWLGKYFVETQQVFGSKAAVAAFDGLGHTLADIAISTSKIPPHAVHRTLDDVLVVTPAGSHAGPTFASHYKSLCASVGAGLAPLCALNDKAFEDQTVGTALGVVFNTTALTWTITSTKRLGLLEAVDHPIAGGKLTLLDMQELMGKLNDFSQMAPFLRAFRFALTSALQHLSTHPTETLVLPPAAIDDLKVWRAVIAASEGSLPIPHRPTLPGTKAITFVSDAAGARFAKVDGRFMPFQDQQGSGGASISCMTDGPIWFCATVTWPLRLLLEARDAQDHAYGCKSPTLEAIAALLPFVCCPASIAGRDVLLLTDNQAVVFGWEPRRIRNDESASIMIRAIHLIACFLGCNVTIQHLPRMSTPSAVLADSLSRASSTGPEELALIQNASSLAIPGALTTWLQSPSEDWSLPTQLLEHVKHIMSEL